MEPAKLISNTICPPDFGKESKLFELNYIKVRDQEHRIYTDQELAELPDIAAGHIHYKEWLIRKKSCQRLVSHFSDKEALNILDIGCGNGWLSNQLSAIRGSSVTGLDINNTELYQAVKVFVNNSNLQFLYGDLRSGIFSHAKFDLIVFAASIQYFSSLTEILDCALSHLNHRGEIHIIDTPFYSESELTAARRRTADYYSSLNIPEMKDYYFHHFKDDLKSYNYSLLYNPNSAGNRLFGNYNPFPWIRIQKD